MKKTTLLFTLLAFSAATFAQKDFQLGLRLAPNLSWIKPDADNVEGDGLKFGFNYGLVGDFNISENYAVSTGITLVNTGGKVIRPDQQDVPNNGASITGYGKNSADIRLKYVEVPITLKLKTNEIGYMKYFGQFGFSVGVNYDASADEEFSYTIAGSTNGATLTNKDVDYADEINAIRAALVVGLGAEYNLSGNTSLIFGITFNNGFTNIFSEDTFRADKDGNALKPSDTEFTGKSDQDLKAINNYLLLNLGILF